jgi:hypothetical protein
MELLVEFEINVPDEAPESEAGAAKAPRHRQAPSWRT